MPNLEDHIKAGTVARNEKQKQIAGLRKTIRQDKKRLASRERKLRRMENSLSPTSLDAKPEPLDFSGIVDKREIEVIKLIAHRFKESRILCAHNYSQAAQLLNITPEDLKKIENAVDVWHVPTWLIKRAAEIYCVPADYLLGIIEDWDAADGEVFLSRNHLAGLQRQEHENFTKLAAEQIRHVNRLTAMNSAVAATVIAIQNITETFGRFTQLNPQFQDMRAGATVLRQIQNAEELAAHATGVLTRYKALPESLWQHAQYMLQEFPEQNGYFHE